MLIIAQGRVGERPVFACASGRPERPQTAHPSGRPERPKAAS